MRRTLIEDGSLKVCSGYRFYLAASANGMSAVLMSQAGFKLPSSLTSGQHCGQEPFMPLSSRRQTLTLAWPSPTYSSTSRSWRQYRMLNAVR